MDVYYENDAFNYYHTPHENTLKIENWLNLNKFLLIGFTLDALHQIVLKKNQKTISLLKSCVLVSNSPYVNTGIIFITIYDNIYIHLAEYPIPIKNDLKNIPPFNSNFGVENMKLFEKMFPSLKEIDFESRFNKKLPIIPEQIITLEENLFPVNNKIIITSFVILSFIIALEYSLNKNLFELSWFDTPTENFTEKVSKLKPKISKKIEQLTNREFLFYVLNKLKNGQRLTEEEISYLLLLLKQGVWRVLKLLRDGLVSIYLIALFIRVIMVLADYFKLLNLKDPIFSPAISKILTKELTLTVENANIEKTDKFENDLTIEIIKEAQTKQFHSLQEELNNELMERIIEKCKNQPRSRYGAILEKRALKIPLTKFNKLGQRIKPIRNDFWCNLGSKNIKETIELEKKRMLALQELESKQIIKSE